MSAWRRLGERPTKQAFLYLLYLFEALREGTIPQLHSFKSLIWSLEALGPFGVLFGLTPPYDTASFIL